MAAIGLGLKAADKVVDKHFDKIPDKYFHPHTYIPGKKAPARCYGQTGTDSGSEEGSESEIEVVGANGSAIAGTEPRRKKSEKKKRLASDKPLPEAPSGVESEKDIPEVEEFDDMQQPSTAGIPRHSGESGNSPYMSGGNPLQPQQYDIPPVYSHDPPKMRQEYMPSPPPVGQYYNNNNYGYGYGYAGYPPASPQPDPSNQYQDPSRSNQRLGRDRNYYNSDEDTNSDTESNDRRSKAASSSSNHKHKHNRRPRPQTRRSSSYHGPRDRNDQNNSYSYGTTSRGRRSGDSNSNSRRDSDAGTAVSTRSKAPSATGSKYHFKEEASDVLTSSKRGIAGSALGAVVGGWVANKAQVAYGRENHHGNKFHETNPLLTLLGAAVGGLAIDAAVAKWEEARSETDVDQKKWNDKYDKGGDESGDGESDRGKDKGKSGGSDTGRERRRRRRRTDRGGGYGSD